MRRHLEHLKSLLEQARSGTISANELVGLVQLSRAIIERYLIHLRPSLAQLCVNQGLTFSDLAYDCIAEAFARGSGMTFPQLNNFFTRLSKNLNDSPEEEVFLAYRMFLTRVADSQLARLYAQSDPDGAKIYRNIREQVKHNSTLAIHRDFRGNVLIPLDAEPLDHLQEFPPDELERRIVSQSDHALTTPQFLKILHDILVQQSFYRRSIPVVDVVQIFKQAYRHDVSTLAELGDPLSAEGLTDYDIERMCGEVEIVLKEKIVLAYYARGKITKRQAEAMIDAFRDILEDWIRSAEQQVNLYQHLHRYLSIDQRAYESHFRAKMEYLLKIARKEFAARLLREI